jgi:hypothetical protein
MIISVTLRRRIPAGNPFDGPTAKQLPYFPAACCTLLNPINQFSTVCPRSAHEPRCFAAESVFSAAVKLSPLDGNARFQQSEEQRGLKDETCRLSLSRFTLNVCSNTALDYCNARLQLTCDELYLIFSLLVSFHFRGLSVDRRSCWL